MSLSRRRDPGIGRGRCDGAGGRVCGGCGSAVSGPGRRARMCGIGAARAVLHIRSGPTSDGSAESCENSPALNAVEILPCAEGPALHMGARPLKTDILEEPRNHAENPEPARAGAALQCAAPPHGPGRTPGAPPENSPGRNSPTTGPGRPRPARQQPLRQDPAVNPNLIRTPRETAPHRTGPWATAPGEKESMTPSPMSAGTGAHPKVTRRPPF